MERCSGEVYRLGSVTEGLLLKFAEILGRNLSGNEILLLFGDLGAGKTTFVKGLAMGLDIDVSLVRSPTFTLVNVYPGEGLLLVHADLYRLEGLTDIYELDLLEHNENSVIVIEWPEKIAPYLEDKVIKIELDYLDDLHRELAIETEDNSLEPVIKNTIDEWINIQGGM